MYLCFSLFSPSILHCLLSFCLWILLSLLFLKKDLWCCVVKVQTVTSYHLDILAHHKPFSPVAKPQQFPPLHLSKIWSCHEFWPLSEGADCASLHLPPRSVQCCWGRRGLLFLIITGCQKPLVLEYFSSGTLAGQGVSWSSWRKEVGWLSTDW